MVSSVPVAPKEVEVMANRRISAVVEANHHPELVANNDHRTLQA